MSAYNQTGTLSLAASGWYDFPLCSKTGEAAVTLQTYDIAQAYCVDLNLTSADAVGQIEIYLQNDQPSLSSFLTAPVAIYAISGGVFTTTNPVSQTKQTFASATQRLSKWVGIKYTRGSGTGSIAIDGMLSLT